MQTVVHILLWALVALVSADALYVVLAIIDYIRWFRHGGKDKAGDA